MSHLARSRELRSPVGVDEVSDEVEASVAPVHPRATNASDGANPPARRPRGQGVFVLAGIAVVGVIAVLVAVAATRSGDRTPAAAVAPRAPTLPRATANPQRSRPAPDDAPPLMYAPADAGAICRQFATRRGMVGGGIMSSWTAASVAARLRFYGKPAAPWDTLPPATAVVATCDLSKQWPAGTIPLRSCPDGTTVVDDPSAAYLVDAAGHASIAPTDVFASAATTDPCGGAR